MKWLGCTCRPVQIQSFIRFFRLIRYWRRLLCHTRMSEIRRGVHWLRLELG